MATHLVASLQRFLPVFVPDQASGCVFRIDGCAIGWS
jgi:hypothetical protein